jgi:hypothetical protein
MFVPKAGNPQYFELLEDVKQFIAQNYEALGDGTTDGIFIVDSEDQISELRSVLPQERDMDIRVAATETQQAQKSSSVDIKILDDTRFITAAPFNEVLISEIDRRGLQDPEVYRKAHISRQQFSRIKNGQTLTPDKYSTVLPLALALELNLPETRTFLEASGYALTRSKKKDLIVEYCISNGIYDLFDVNSLLFDYHEEPLGSMVRE